MCRTIPQGASVYSACCFSSASELAELKVKTPAHKLMTAKTAPTERSQQWTYQAASASRAARSDAAYHHSGTPAALPKVSTASKFWTPPPPSCLLLPSSKAQKRRDSYLENGGGYERRNDLGRQWGGAPITVVPFFSFIPPAVSRYGGVNGSHLLPPRFPLL